jgi:phosphoserine phosphatase RsbU/P
MAGRQGISLKYKILFMLTLLPLVMLTVYMFVALNIFKMDKIAYVYESSTAVARTLSSQASTELSSVLISAKPLMQEFLLKSKFSDVSKEIFNVDSPLQWMAAYQPKPENPSIFDQMGIIEKENISAEIDLKQLPALNDYLLEALSRGRTIQVPFHDDRVLIIERVGDGSYPMTRLFLMMSKLSELATAFKNPGATENYLITEEGKVLFGPGESGIEKIAEVTGLEFVKNINEQRFQSGAQGFKGTQGTDLLASFSKAGFGGTAVVTLVPQDEALRAVRILILRSVIFMFVLVSLTIIVSLFASGNLTSSISDLFLATKRVAEGQFDIRVQVKSNDEVGSLADSFNTMAGEVSRLMGETADKARMESELKTAQTVQETLFPSPNVQIGTLKVSGFYEPASECGGDWWHYCQINDKVFLWIGDATGHGAPAALITSAAKSAATIIERLNVDVSQAMSLLNRAIYDVSKGKIMMTFFLGCYDQKTHKFSYSNASHEAPFLIRRSAQAPKKKDLIPLNEVNDPRLGQGRETQYQQTELQLEKGDRILFYTDGIPDIQNPEMQSWGEREFIKAILASNAQYAPVEKVVQNLVHRFSEFRQGTQLKDDITFFMCQYVENSSS